ncbi:MAG: DNA starvation/stationary phase protection protein [Leptospirales bacterium]|nr:DNA starvation/stationary phase protection protein [Leptospirales bacterium]
MKINTGIGDSDRAAISAGLRKVLADTYTLYLKTHNYHWNVTGPMFDSLHRLFMEQYTELWNAVDLVAERIRSLGEFAPGTYEQFAKLTKIKEESQPPKAAEMLQNLVGGHETLIETLREAFPAAEQANDQATMDLLTQRLQIHEKTAWMLRTMLE